jgi:hypothetical protein
MKEATWPCGCAWIDWACFGGIMTNHGVRPYDFQYSSKVQFSSIVLSLELSLLQHLR